MSSSDIEFRFKIAGKFPKFLPFDESLNHLDHVDPFFTPIQAATYFRDFWQNKYDEFSNHILHKNEAEAYREQYFLAEKRVYKVKSGVTLQIDDFLCEIFDKSCPEFSSAIFLMETFYEFPSMFFEIFEDIESYHKNEFFGNNEDIESYNKNEICENIGDFVDSHPKNDIESILGDLADSHPKNGAFVISGFLTFFTRKKGNFRVFLNGRFCNAQPPYFVCFTRFDNLMSRAGPSKVKPCSGRGHRFLMTLEQKVTRFKLIFSTGLRLNLLKSIYFNIGF